MPQLAGPNTSGGCYQQVSLLGANLPTTLHVQSITRHNHMHWGSHARKHSPLVSTRTSSIPQQSQPTRSSNDPTRPPTRLSTDSFSHRLARRLIRSLFAGCPPTTRHTCPKHPDGQSSTACTTSRYQPYHSFIITQERRRIQKLRFSV